MNDEKWWQKKQIQLEIPNEKKPSVYGYCDNEKKREKKCLTTLYSILIYKMDGCLVWVMRRKKFQC